jgi:(4-alkanoyl-5-oxo-2,5-dihydrofuran-3-yl)methyl phosphate reductase
VVEVDPAAARQVLVELGVSGVMADAIMALRATALEAFTSVVYPMVEALTDAKPATFRQWAGRHRNRF